MRYLTLTEALIIAEAVTGIELAIAAGELAVAAGARWLDPLLGRNA